MPRVLAQRGHQNSKNFFVGNAMNNRVMTTLMMLLLSSCGVADDGGPDTGEADTIDKPRVEKL